MLSPKSSQPVSKPVQVPAMHPTPSVSNVHPSQYPNIDITSSIGQPEFVEKFDQDGDDGFGPGSNSDEEDRTHSSVLGRHMRKRRRTNSALISAAPASPFSPSSFTLSPPHLGFDMTKLDDEDDMFSRRRKGSIVPQSDVIARQRCYEYLHTAIDAVWAEFCNSTSYAENQKYMPHSPTSESDEFIEGDWPLKPNKRSDSISLQPQSRSLMKQKKRLTNAKDLLAHFVNVPDMHSSKQFWKTWDVLKSQSVELVDGEVDDDEYDEVINDLEAGRC